MKNFLEEKITSKPKTKKDKFLPVSIIITIFVVGAWLYTVGLKERIQEQKTSTELGSQGQKFVSELEEKVLPSEGVILPVVWGNFGVKLISSGTIDEKKFKSIYERRGAFTDEYKKLLLGENNDKLKITRENSSYLLNLFWAFGLANKNSILETGKMTNPAYGGVQNFASTSG